MYISIFELFSIGIGPSSSHTVGPMRCAYDFISKYFKSNKNACFIEVELYGSLSFTGLGHYTDKAIILGLMGFLPENVEVDTAEKDYKKCKKTKKIIIQDKVFDFVYNKNLIFKKEFLPYHSNAMMFKLYDKNKKLIIQKDYYSTGGGFFINGDDINKPLITKIKKVPHNFKSSKELMQIVKKENISISELMFDNEASLKLPSKVKKDILNIWEVMDDSIARGIKTGGVLSGGLKVKRRAKNLYELLQKELDDNTKNHSLATDWISLYALAINEENAMGGKVVTAPTNGAAGIIPAILKYYLSIHPSKNSSDIIVTYLLTACAIGNLYKNNASISAAEVGCQGEIGVACSMAAGALVAIEGGTAKQVEHAAEIGMEHHLGLTCDPIKGLVQIPCIERNSIGANTALTAAKLALREDGTHIVSLDKVIQTMLKTGKEMSSNYKETSKAGLALNTIEC